MLTIDPKTLGIVSTAAFVAHFVFFQQATFGPVLIAVVMLAFLFYPSFYPSVAEGYVPDAPSELVVRNDVEITSTLLPSTLGFYDGITSALERLNQVKSSEIGAYETIVTLIERFFRLYERIMIGKAACSELSRMADLKDETLNNLHAFVFNVTSKENILIEQLTSEIHAIMFHFLKIARRRCMRDPNMSDARLPNGYDPRKSTHDLY